MKTENKNLGYNEELQQAAQEAMALTEFWTEVLEHLDSAEEEQKALVEKRPGQ